MSAFHFVAIKTNGKQERGVIEAENEKHARQLLREKALVPIQINLSQTKPVHKESFLNRFSRGEKSLSSKDLSLITRQFSTLLSAGLPLEEALLAVASQSEKSHVKGLLLSVRGKILEGNPLASALREFPQSFTPLYCATIAAGEKSGHLDKVLMRLADYTEQQFQMRQKLKTALIYPVMIILVAIGIVGFLLEYVVPKMVAVYGHLNQSLPLLTDILISISSFIQSYGFYLLVLFGILFFAFRFMVKRNPLFAEKTHYFYLRLALIGYALKTADTARFARTLSILSAAGVSVLEAMTISAQLITTIPINKAVCLAVDRVKEGSSIHLALKQTKFFSPMSIHMISSGEASGQLENMLERVAKAQEDEITRLIDVALALFEPAIILLMGAIVLFIVLAVLLPIFQLNEFTG